MGAGGEGGGWWVVHGLHPVADDVCISLLTLYYKVKLHLWVNQHGHGVCRVTSKGSHTHRTLTHCPGSSPDRPWPLSMQVNPQTRFCVNRGEGYWWFDIDSHSNVTLENVSLIEDSVNDIEFTYQSRFYTDVLWPQTVVWLF